jgi:hypothetical protein
VRKPDEKLQTELKDACDILHLAGDYDGVGVKVIHAGSEIAESIVNRLAA